MNFRASTKISCIGLAVLCLSVTTTSASAETDLSGFYGGIAVGSAYGESNPDSNGELTPYFTGDDPELLRPGLQKTISGSSLTGSVLAGYDHQDGALVYGIEADLSVMDYSETSSAGPTRYNSASVDFNTRTTIETNFAFSIRPKIGYVIDNWTIHAAAGPSIAQFDYDFRYSDTNDGGANNTFDKSTLALGISSGAGVSYKMENGWSIRGDYVFNYYPEIIDERQSFMRDAGGTDYRGSFDHQSDFLSHNLRFALIKHF